MSSLWAICSSSIQPVNGNPIFETVHKKAICYKLGCATSVNIWSSSVEYDELTINERQKKDGGFSTILDSVRQGNLTDESAPISE